MIDRYPFRIAVARYPDDPVKNDAQYLKYPLTVEGSQISAWYEDERLGRSPMNWTVEQDRPSFKEMWLLFKNADHEFPLLTGQSGSVTYQYTASCQHWGPWSKRKIRLRTDKLSLEFSFPAWMQPEIVGLEWVVARPDPDGHCPTPRWRPHRLHLGGAEPAAQRPISVRVAARQRPRQDDLIKLPELGGGRRPATLPTSRAGECLAAQQWQRCPWRKRPVRRIRRRSG